MEEAEKYYQQGLEHYQQASYHLALPLFEKAASLLARDTHWNAVGNCLWAAGKFKSAIPAYEKAIDLNPNDPVLRNNLANTYVFLEDYHAFLKTMLPAIRLNQELTYGLQVARWSKVRSWLESQDNFTYNQFGLALIEVQNHCNDAMMLIGFVKNYNNFLMVLSQQGLNYGTRYIAQTFAPNTVEYQQQYAHSLEMLQNFLSDDPSSQKAYQKLLQNDFHPALERILPNAYIEYRRETKGFNPIFGR